MNTKKRESMGFGDKLRGWYNGESVDHTRSVVDPAIYGDGNSGLVLPGAQIPARTTPTVSVEGAMELNTVYRAVSIITTNVSQLELVSKKQGVVKENSLTRRPNLNQTLSQFLKQTTLDLVGYGNCYWKITRSSTNNLVINLDIWDPNNVQINYTKSGRKFYVYEGVEYNKDDVYHLKNMELPGHNKGIGPIQAFRMGIYRAKKVKQYGDEWFDNSGVPTGVLSTTEDLDAETAAQWRADWTANLANARGTAVLGNGLKYESIYLNPEDAMWIQALESDIKAISIVFGIPPTWLLAEVGGNSMTYTNQESAWIDFVRNTLSLYLKEIEDAFTELTGNGTSVKFNVDGLLRPDSKARAEIYTQAIASGWLTVDEVRAREGLPPLTAAQKKELKPEPVAPVVAPDDKEEETDD